MLGCVKMRIHGRVERVCRVARERQEPTGRREISICMEDGAAREEARDEAIPNNRGEGTGCIYMSSDRPRKETATGTQAHLFCHQMHHCFTFNRPPPTKSNTQPHNPQSSSPILVMRRPQRLDPRLDLVPARDARDQRVQRFVAVPMAVTAIAGGRRLVPGIVACLFVYLYTYEYSNA